MATSASYNKKSSSVKRILSEARELSSDPSPEYTAAPLEDNIFEWHFTLRGPPSSEFQHGLYHGRIILPAEYPMRPPNLMFLTPNGRWELNKKICLTFTGFHEEMWQPAWGIRTALLGVQTFMTARAEMAIGIGALDYSIEVREKLAKESRSWSCSTCKQCNLELLPDPDPSQGPRQVEALPEGLTVDPVGGKPRQKGEDGVEIESATKETERAPDDSVGPVIAPEAGPSATLASGATVVDDQSPAAAVGISTPLVAEQPLSAPDVPTTVTPASPSASAPVSAQVPAQVRSPATSPHRAHQPVRTQSSLRPSASLPSVSATEQKLNLLDRCIALLVGLVALLIIRRLL